MGKPSAPRRLADNEAMAFAKRLRISPQKLNLVAGAIRGMPCESALAELEFSKRRIAADVRKVLESAIANAENNHQLDVDRLYVAEASVGRSLVMKRWRPRARGRSARLNNPFSNLRLVVRESEESAYWGTRSILSGSGWGSTAPGIPGGTPQTATPIFSMRISGSAISSVSAWPRPASRASSSSVPPRRPGSPSTRPGPGW